MANDPDIPDTAALDAGPTARGPWNATASGGAWSILEPRQEDVRFDDIANALSKICRFNGQIREDLDFFSVAEHCSIMARWALAHMPDISAEDALAVLLHDGSEAYFGDMTTEIKKVIPEYRIWEKSAQDAVNKSFGLDGCRMMLRKREIKDIDTRMFMAECEVVLPDPANNHLSAKVRADFPHLVPLDVKIGCVSSKHAREAFVDTFLHIVENVPHRDPDWIFRISHHIDNARSMLTRIRPNAPDALSKFEDMHIGLY